MAALPTLRQCFIVGLVLLLAGCVVPAEKPEASAPTKTDAQEVPLATLEIGDVRGFPATEIEWVQGTKTQILPVFLASTPGHRSRGLMGVTSLGDMAGMAFQWPGTTLGSFWMKDTLIPLEIAFVDTEGVVFAVIEMEPCVAEPCPSYKPDGAYHLALEWPAGSLEIGVGDVLRLESNSR